MPARNSPQIRWAFRRYCNISVLNSLKVFIHSPMSINFSAFRNMWEYLIFRRRFLDEMDFFPIFLTCASLAVTEAFPVLSNLSSREWLGRYVKLLQFSFEGDINRSMQHGLELLQG